MIKINRTLRIHGPLDHPEMRRLKHCIEAILNSYSYGTLIISRGGLGKTRSIREMIESSGFVEGQDWIHIAANITDTELYKILYNNKDKIIFFDDIGKAAKTAAGVTILKQATETKDGKKRIVSWVSPTYILKEYPLDFEFNGRLIMCLNIKPNENDGDIEALTSRFLSCVLEPSNKTILEMIYSIRKKLTEGVISDKEFEHIFDHVCLISNENTEINIRAFKNAIVWYKLSEDWKRYVEEDIGLDHDTKTVILIISSGYKGKAATDEWMKSTGKKKSTFYNIFERLRKDHVL
jgi:hypothetical protein